MLFLQAEDGIRYADVTGVQTCALPISSVAQSRLSTPSTIVGSLASSADSRRSSRCAASTSARTAATVSATATSCRSAPRRASQSPPAIQTTRSVTSTGATRARPGGRTATLTGSPRLRLRLPRAHSATLAHAAGPQEGPPARNPQWRARDDDQDRARPHRPRPPDRRLDLLHHLVRRLDLP